VTALAQDRLAYLATVMPPTPWFELRTRNPAGTWTKHWPQNTDEADEIAREHATQGHEVYAGLAARHGRHGDQAKAYGDVGVLWADLDSSRAVAKAAMHEPPPTLLVRSGSRDEDTPKLHAYWKLSAPLPAPEANQCAERLSRHLDADLKALGEARVMRVPGSLNLKSGRVCRIEAFTGEAFTPEEVLQDIPASDAPPVKAPKPKATDELVELFLGHYQDGEGRHEHFRSVVGVLLRRCGELPPDVLLELAVCWAKTHTSPCKDDRELERNFDNLLARERNRRGIA
jgi:hypothetical protein